MYLGIDIGGTAVKYGIVTEDGRVETKAEYSVNFDGYQTAIGNTIVTTSELFLKKNNISLENIKGIGVSATGQINVKEGIVAGVGGNISNWANTNIKTLLEQKYGLPVTVVNDANCVALGEQWVGSAKGKQNVIVITIGTGIGGGMIQKGEILLGTNGFAGELGHFSIDKNGKQCTCGNIGCFEQYGSMTALVNKIKMKNVIDKELINGRIIFEQVGLGNKELMPHVEQWIDDIAIGLTSLVHIFNPELIIVGGGVSKQENLFIQPLREKIKAKVMPNFGKDLEVKSATLGNDAGLVGGVYYFLRSHSLI